MNTLAKYLKGTKSMILTKVSIVALLVIFTFTSAFAADKTAPDFKGSEIFKKAYPLATDVQFEVKKDYTVVNFMWNGLKLQAFYDNQGNALGTSRQITVSSLPLSYMVNIKNQYPGFEATEAIEFDQAVEGLNYYVTIVGPQKSYVLKIASEGTISVFKKMKN